MTEATEDTASPAAGRAADEPIKRGKTVHGEAANAGHRVLAPDDAEVEAYLETALKAPGPDRSPDDRPSGAMATAPGTVVVLDFGSQFAQLIARRVRELDVYSELLPHDTPFEEIERRGARAIILSGGPMSVYDADAPRPDPAVWSGRLPVLGICYGAQMMAHELGGDVIPADRREYGPASVTITADDGLFTGIDREQPVWMSHGDSITRLPEGFHATAQTDSNPFAGLAAPERNLYGIQFHPEVVHTPRGRDVLRNFVQGIAGIAPTWTATNFIDTTVAGIAERVDRHAAETGSDGLVICALSGGVDSAVAAALVHRAVGDRLTCIYVDHGLMRKKESELLRVTFERDLGMNLVMVDARQRFLARLAGVEDPEKKRKIIGDEFIRVFEEEAAKLGRHRLPDPGHAVSGRDRVGDVGDEGRPEDQDPPQRGRPAGRPALPAHRAAALSLQGRGPQGRPGDGPPRGDGPPSAVPGTRSGHPDHRRGHRRTARHPARGGLDRHRRDQGRRACTAACGRASRS